MPTVGARRGEEASVGRGACRRADRAGGGQRGARPGERRGKGGGTVGSGGGNSELRVRGERTCEAAEGGMRGGVVTESEAGRAPAGGMIPGCWPL